MTFKIPSSLIKVVCWLVSATFGIPYMWFAWGLWPVDWLALVFWGGLLGLANYIYWKVAYREFVEEVQSLMDRMERISTTLQGRE